MLVLSLLPLLLVTGAFAAPSRRDASSIPATAMDLPSGQNQLVAPTTAPKFVALAVGMQDFTCIRNGTFGWVVVALSFVHGD